LRPSLLTIHILFPKYYLREQKCLDEWQRIIRHLITSDKVTVSFEREGDIVSFGESPSVVHHTLSREVHSFLPRVKQTRICRACRTARRLIFKNWKLFAWRNDLHVGIVTGTAAIAVAVCAVTWCSFTVVIEMVAPRGTVRFSSRAVCTIFHGGVLCASQKPQTTNFGPSHD